ncbi:MAG: UbiA family prenyltransferase [Promethearchaeota archaeon]
MLKKKVKGFLKLIRIDITLFGSIALFIAGILAGDLTEFQIEFVIAFFIIFFTAAGAFAFNDYYDFEIDKNNNRMDRPLVSGLLSKRGALITSIISFLAVIGLSLLLNLIVIISVFISLPLFYLYSMGLKKKLFIKNFLIALAYLATIFLGSLVIDAMLEPLIIYFGIMGFIVGFANENMFDIADVKGDKELGIETFSTKFGVKTAAWLSVSLYIVIIGMDPLPFFLLIDQRLHSDFLFLGLILIPVVSYIFISKSLLKDQSGKNILKLRKRLFFVMQIGTLAYLAGVLI